MKNSIRRWLVVLLAALCISPLAFAQTPTTAPPAAPAATTPATLPPAPKPITDVDLANIPVPSADARAKGVANWAWGGGWLANLGTNFGLGKGYCDFAGSGVVHAVGGLSALAIAMILGPRIGKFREVNFPQESEFGRRLRFTFR